MPPCAVYHQNQGVGISASTGYTGLEAYGLMTGWIVPELDVQRRRCCARTPARSSTDDAVFTRVAPASATASSTRGSSTTSRASASTTSSSRATCRPIVGIAGFYRREAARLPHDDAPVRRAGLGPHAVHQHGNQPGRAACYELDGKFEHDHARAERQGVRLRHRRGHLRGADPGRLRARRPRRAGARRRESPDWGPADVPAASAPPDPPTGRRAAASRARPRGRSSRSSPRKAASRSRSPPARPARPR